jgi:O-antigen/teichoic acid export membrane protein
MLAILLFIDVVKYFIDPRYHGGLHVVPVLLVANLLLGVYYNFSVWYRLKDRTGLGAWISIAGAAITIGLNLFLIPLYGYTGAAWVTLVCYAFMVIATWLTGKKYYPVPYPLARMVGYSLSALVLAGISYGLCIYLPDWLKWLSRILLLSVYVWMVWKLEVKTARFDK